MSNKIKLNAIQIARNINHRYLTSTKLYPFEVLAEIFDFVAGLVQRVPKKPNEMKADL